MVQVWYGDGSFFQQNFVINTLFKVMHSFLILAKFAKDAEVLDIANRDLILGLSCVIECK